MNKIQHLSFRTIDDFLDYLPTEEFIAIEKLRSLIKECLPDVIEKISYNVPFYSRNKSICYLWPASVPWGKVKDGHITLGFLKGHQLPDPYNRLEKGNRKFVRTLTLNIAEDLDIEMIRFYLFEAFDLDK